MLMLDLLGEKYGRLTVTERAGYKGRNILWRCFCDCGKEKFATTPALRHDGTRSCGCLRREVTAMIHNRDLQGQTFGRLTVLEKRNHIDRRRVEWACQCECGSKTSVITHGLTSGGTKSCGCLQKEKARKHMTELGKKQKGINHPSWRGGSKIYPEQWTPRFTNTIRHRDGVKCKVCDAKTRLDVHHINENIIDCRGENLITLCRRCHRRLHSGREPLRVAIQSLIAPSVPYDEPLFVGGGYTLW